MPEDFRGPFLKYQRARTHFDDLHGLLKEFLKNQTFVAVANFDLEPGYIWWIARGMRLFRHDEFSPFIGDIIHNLRDSLDIAMSVLMRNSGESDVGVYFPTGDSIDHFHTAIGKRPNKQRRSPPKFPPNVIDVLETRIEPYKGGHNHWLRTLHQLAIIDKHRTIVPTYFGADIVVLPEIPILFPDTRVPIEDGCKLLRMPADWRDGEIKINQEASLVLSIEFDKGTPLHGTSVEDGLLSLINATEEAIETLETCLGSPTVDRYFSGNLPGQL